MALSSALLTLILTPLIITCSICLLPFAIITTTLALSTLALRVFAVYLELALAIVTDHLISSRRTSRYQSPPSPRLSKSHRSLSISSDSQTPKQIHQGVIYSANTPLVRDYEGVGGWRFSNEEDTENEWVTLNARLELPAVAAIPAERKRKHARSLTQGSLGDRALLRRSKVMNRPRSAIVTPGTVSPEDKLRDVGRVKSAIMLGQSEMNVGRSRSGGRRKSSSSESSGSGRTLTIKGGTG